MNKLKEKVLVIPREWQGPDCNICDYILSLKPKVLQE